MLARVHEKGKEKKKKKRWEPGVGGKGVPERFNFDDPIAIKNTF